MLLKFRYFKYYSYDIVSLDIRQHEIRNEIGIHCYTEQHLLLCFVTCCYDNNSYTTAVSIKIIYAL
jgi:hypothetical protein